VTEKRFFIFWTFLSGLIGHSRRLKNECVEEVKAEAQACRFCGFEFPEQGFFLLQK
jgi:hypothetical protein